MNDRNQKQFFNVKLSTSVETVSMGASMALENKCCR